MIYDSANPHSTTNRAAQPGSDYTLQYFKKTVIPTSGGSSVSYDWETLSYTSSTTLGTVTRYHYTSIKAKTAGQVAQQLLKSWPDGDNINFLDNP